MNRGQADVSVAAGGLRKTFEAPGGGPLYAVDGVSLQVRQGELTALVGPDGAGKTTLLRMIAGLLKPDGGTLRVLGIDVTQDPQAVQDRISYMPQRFGLYEDLTVQENLELYADLHGVPHEVRRKRFARMLEMTDMARFTSRLAGKLSGGMKQKLGLACTLVRSPALLLLDEPSVGVDPLSRRELWKIVQQLVEDERLSVIVSTAYMDEAERCAQVFVMNQGKVLTGGTPQALAVRVRVLTFVAPSEKDIPARDLQARLIDARDLIVDAVPSGGAVRFIRQPEADTAKIDALLEGLPVKPRQEELEDAFMMLLRQHQDGDTAAASQAVPQVTTNKTADGNPVIVVRDLVRKFGDFTAVASTSFEVGVVSENGK
ncbi:ABC transporter ATP-binding protein [Citrobacter freundii]